MDADCHDALQRIAAHALIVAERCKDRRIQEQLVNIANELIGMMVGREAPDETPAGQKLN